LIVAHLADLHLGFSAYGRVEGGRNTRELDVEAAFLRAVDELARVRPDAVLIAGDVFDRPDPPSSALVPHARGVELLRESLPGAPVLIAAGPRDASLDRADPGLLAALDTVPGVEAAVGAPRSVRVGELSVHLLPHRATMGESAPPPEPDPTARWNVLVAHTRAATDPRGEGASGRRSGARVLRVDAGAWDYVALGGEHVHRALLPHVRWAGSLERIGWRPWDEALEEKGFLTYDLASGRATFHPVAVRAVVSLAPIRVQPGDPTRLRRRVRQLTDEVPGGIDGKIVLVRIQGAAPEDLGGLTEDLLPALRARALHLAVALVDPARKSGPRAAADDLRPRLAALLESEGVAESDSPGRAAMLLGGPAPEARVS
jgi:DNA repair exonuclease SbcCD nuclease subunit